jgi:hypothetical protein
MVTFVADAEPAHAKSSTDASAVAPATRQTFGCPTTFFTIPSLVS